MKEHNRAPRLLLPQHKSLLEDAAIDPSLAQRQGVYSVRSAKELPFELRRKWGDLWGRRTGLVFRYSDGEQEVPQVRPDTPLAVPGRDRALKYVFPSGIGSVLNVLRAPRQSAVTALDGSEQARTSSGLCLIVEGTKQGLAALTHAPESAAVLGIAGCACWSVPKSRGEPLPALALVEGQDVVVILDADYRTNSDVTLQAQRLDAACVKLGARSVRFATIPAAGSSTDGLDDWLGDIRPERRARKLQQLIDEASPLQLSAAGPAFEEHAGGGIAPRKRIKPVVKVPRAPAGAATAEPIEPAPLKFDEFARLGKVDSTSELSMARLIMDGVVTQRGKGGFVRHAEKIWVYDERGVFVAVEPNLWLEPYIQAHHQVVYVDEMTPVGPKPKYWDCTHRQVRAITADIMRELARWQQSDGHVLDNPGTVAVFGDQTLVDEAGVLKLVPNGPEHRATRYYPVELDPDAEPAYLLSVMREDWFRGVPQAEQAKRIQCLREYMGAALTGLGHRAGLDRMLVNMGHGHDGKSTFTSIVKKLLEPFGDDACTSVSYAQLCGRRGDTFGGKENTPSRLAKATANISDDTEGGTWTESEVWKAMLRGQAVDGREIGRDGASYRSRAVWLANANYERGLPKLDVSEATLDRLLCLQWPNTVDPRYKAPGLDDDLLAVERDAIVSWAVRGLIDLVNGDRRQTMPDCHTTLLEAWKRRGSNDPSDLLGTFVAQVCAPNDDRSGGMTTAELQGSFVTWLVRNLNMSADGARRVRDAKHAKLLEAAMQDAGYSKSRANKPRPGEKKRLWVWDVLVQRVSDEDDPGPEPEGGPDGGDGTNPPDEREEVESSSVPEVSGRERILEDALGREAPLPSPEPRPRVRRGEQATLGLGLDASWSPPCVDELPDWPIHGVVSLDLEGYDPQIAAPDKDTLCEGYHDPNAYVVGICLAFDGQGWYLPIAHAGGGNLDRGAVLQYLERQVERFRGTITGCNVGRYDLGFFAKKLGLRFHEEVQVKDIRVAACLADNLRPDLSLAGILEWLGIRGKDEKGLVDAALDRYQKSWGKRPKRAKDEPEKTLRARLARFAKGNLWRLPAWDVGPYGERDSLGPLEALAILERRIKAERLDEVWALETEVTSILLDLNLRGIRVDRDKLAQAITYFEAALATGRAAVASLIGEEEEPELVSLEPGTLGETLARVGFDVPLTPKSGRPSVTDAWLDEQDDDRLKLAARARKAQTALRRLRKVKRQMALTGADRVFYSIDQSAFEDEGGGKGKVRGVRVGRCSCARPNMQQVGGRDEEFGPIERGVYVADEGMQLAEADFSAQEPRWQIHLAVDRGVPGAEDAARDCRDEPGWNAHKRTMRLTGLDKPAAKACGLGVSYGMGSKKFCITLGMEPKWVAYVDRERRFFDTEGEALEACTWGEPRLGGCEESERVLQVYKDAHPFLEPLIRQLKDEVNATGYLRTHTGRILRFAPPGPVAMERGERYDELHKVLNRAVQGSAADHTKLSLVAAKRAGLLPYIHLPVHDSILASVPDDATAQRLSDTMTSSVELSVPMLVEWGSGDCWADLKG